MVSDVLDLEPEELLQELHRIRRESEGDPEYQELRRALPAEWPI
jgi:hypothetical protein